MRSALLLFSCALAGLAQIQPGQPAPPEERATFRIPVNTVIAPTTVLTKKGEYVNGIQLGDFTLYDNGKPQKITADVAFEPLSLVVDVQASADLEEILPKIQKIGIEMSVLVAGADGEVSVVAFDHRIRVMQDFTTESTKVEQAFRQITPGGQNHQLIDAVNQSVRMLQKRPTERRRVILVIAEKRDKASQGKLREVMEAVQLANISIYAVDISSVIAGLTSKGQPPPPPPIPVTAQAVPAGAVQTPTSIDQNYYNGNYIPVFVDIFKGVKSLFSDDTLDVFTRYTGGKQYSFIKKETLDKAVSSIADEIHSQYLLSYVPNNQDEGGFHDIKVVVNRPGLEVRTRPGYWKAATPTP